jgi:GTP-binding protein Era
MIQKAAFVAVVGRPSAGKSTLVNTLCGAKVAIVSPVPQTTRNAIRGIVNREQGQLVFVDTPGRHLSERKFNRHLMDVAGRAQAEADLILYVLDASRETGPEEEAIAERLTGSQGKLVAAINKIDSKSADEKTIREFLTAKLPNLDANRIIPVSALQGDGTEALLSCLFTMAEPGEPFYPPEYYTDQDVSFRIAEIIREKAIARLRQELPHSLYVEVADAELKASNAVRGNGDNSNAVATDGGAKKLWVRAFIITERESQKGMIVGKGGAMIKAIRKAALKDLKELFDWKIELDLRVKTARDWRHNDAVLRRLVER